MQQNSSLQKRLPQDSYENPLAIAHGINPRHWISEKAKAYSYFTNGFPEDFDKLEVEYHHPENGWLRTVFYKNGEKLLEVPLNDWNDPLVSIVDWLEELIEEYEDLNDKTLHIDCDLGLHFVLHYEPLNARNVGYGILFIYGSWTEDYEESCFSVFCTKLDIINAIYTPMIKHWMDLSEKFPRGHSEDWYDWWLSFKSIDCPEEMLQYIRRTSIESRLQMRFPTLNL